VYLDGFDTLAARPIDGKIGGFLVFILDLQAAKGLMSPWYFYVEVEVNAKYAKGGYRRYSGEML
jgi:hypothetical protein